MSKADFFDAKSGDQKTRLVILTHALDKPDAATAVSGARRLANDKKFRILNSGELRSGATRAQIDAGLNGNNGGKGLLLIWFVCHGAPGYVLGTGPSIKNETAAARVLAETVCRIQDKLGQCFDGIMFRSCYSAVEYVGASPSQLLASTARLTSMCIPGIYSVGYFGKENGSSTMGGLVDDKNQATLLSVTNGTAGFFKGKSIEATPNPNIFAPIVTSVQQELTATCSVNLTKLPLCLIPNENLFFIENRAFAN